MIKPYGDTEGKGFSEWCVWGMGAKESRKGRLIHSFSTNTGGPPLYLAFFYFIILPEARPAPALNV